MKKGYSLAFMMALAMLQTTSLAPSLAQTTVSEQLMTVTLYSPVTHKLTNAPPLPNGMARPDSSRAYFSFISGRLATPESWNLSYGTPFGGDWFFVGLGIENDRSTIRDLGRVGWNDKLKVPVVAPLPELKPGEARYITANIKRQARGLSSDVRGAPSAQEQISTPTRDPDDWPRFPPALSSIRNAGRGDGETSITIGPKNSKRSKPAPVLARVVIGHLYVIHVVKGRSDFYVLLRVDRLVPGDNCTISWKRIPSP